MPSNELPIHVDQCVFMDGFHAFAGKSCPHNTPGFEDEMGTAPEPGWTVQQGSPIERVSHG